MDNTVYRNYYKIPTTSGDFYLYREYINRGWDNTTGGTDYYYNDFIEFFTGVVASFTTKSLDIRNKKEKIIFDSIKDELFKIDEDGLSHLLRYNPYISYHDIHFKSSYKSDNAFFANKPYYDNKLPYNDTRFIIELAPMLSIEREKFVYPDYDYHKLTSSEFASEIKELINVFGSYEAVSEAMLKRIKKQALICKERNEFIQNELNKDPFKNAEAEEYIKKLIYKKD